jgi:NADH dehydrogenase [ubiquinone] 1 alpha subcomplex assembly factor 7
MSERLDAFMARANAAYYAGRNPFADFTTAPEIAQAFGEVLGLWAASQWLAMGSPDPVLLVEAGPGRGTLMADALRAIGKAAPGLARALRLHLIETSPRLRALTAERLPGAAWHEDLATLPAGPMLLLANEFLDALPIRQFVRRGTGWAERFVREGAFAEVAAEPPLKLPAACADGDVAELGETARGWTGAVARRIVAEGGAALIVDYGPAESAPGDSLQAVRDGKPADPLADPGSADLTAHVDFAALAAVARGAGAAVFGPQPQGKFLASIGLYQRTDALARANPGRAAALIAAAQRLCEPHLMGRLFKALAICHPALPAPDGFAA